MTEQFDVDRARGLLASEDEEVRRGALAEIPEGWSAGVLVFLIEAMGDASWRVRKDAVSRISRWPDPDGAVTPLISTLADDSNVGLRNAAIEALTLIGPASVPPLCTALAAGGEHRKFLIEALGAIGDRRAVASLVSSLDDVDENVRAAAAEALGALGGPDAAAALRERLRRADLLARLAILEALNRMGAALSLDEVSPMLGQPILRRGALRALGNTGAPEALMPLVTALTDRVRGAREAAAAALHSLHEAQTSRAEQKKIEAAVAAAPPDAVSALVNAVSADDVSIRRAAVTLLGWGRFGSALPRLVDALRDEEIHGQTVRAIVAFGAEAAPAIAEIARDALPELRSEIFAILPRMSTRDARVTALLAQALEDEDADAAAAAARALGEIGGKDALAPLFRALEREDDPVVPQAAGQALARLGQEHHDEVRMLIGARGLADGEVAVHLCRILGAIGRPEDRPLLLKALRGGEPRLRRAAATAVAQIVPDDSGPPREVREALGYALADEEVGVRAAAAESLGWLGDREAVPSLIGALADEEEPVRVEAARALGALGDPRAAAALRERARGQGALALHALEALGRLPRRGEADDDGLDDQLISEALDHIDAEVVKAAVRALDARGGAAVVPGLTRALAHSRWDVRRLAAGALGARAADEPEARAALAARLGAEDDALVSEAIAAALAAPTSGSG